MTTATDELLDFDEAISRFDPVIGIEVHIELSTKSKMFDDAPNSFGDRANSRTTPTSLGLPGTLPVLNRTAVEYAIRIGLALGCSIAESSRFARKNYFYPDIPKNFQISQFDEPIAFDGELPVELDDGSTVAVAIERAHMEEDAGKNTHVGGTAGRIHGAAHSLVDYNRAGVPLIEIVTRPIYGTGARAPEVARAYVHTLRDIFRALGVSEARMEQGNMRADINVSLREGPDAPLGTRTETKNVNSFRSIERAVRYEVSRQAAILVAGGTVTQETRHWHEDSGTTSAGRPKSDAEDYRYFPEPDLLPVQPSREWIEEIRASLPELPAVRRRRLQEAWGYTDVEMRDVVNANALDVVEATIAAGSSPADARKWWLGELARVAAERDMALAELPVTPEHITELSALIDSGRITDKIAREVLAGVLAGEGSPGEVVSARGLEVVSDDTELLALIDEALAAQPDVADKIRGGRVQAAGAIVGAVMKATGGQADAARVRELIMERVS
ncbi:MAG TPA: Asp-tRNA(Asn)/Glu-tRNA(Gln) amidotransferase subunit GatB [Actinomycetaceae bacterium]|nr:Asp-tRNA(Asn)/Glu-tRNA(Gln) amidotransferase subunit GatB [Actinomycetaceae bacterium]